MFPIYASSRGTPGSRDRLSPGPAGASGPLRSTGGALPPGHVYATLPGREAGAASCPALAATTSPAALLHARARTEAHTSTLADPGPLCFKHTPLPHL